MDILNQFSFIHSITGLIHTILALAAMVLGTVVLLRPKATKSHKVMGYVYCLFMLMVNGSALMIYNFGRPNLFHFFAIVSLSTLSFGLWQAYTKRGKHWLERHYYFMSWSVIGLYCAFWAETGTRTLQMEHFWWTVMLISTATAVVGAYLIERYKSNFIKIHTKVN